MSRKGSTFTVLIALGANLWVVREHLRSTDDPTLRAVLTEDLAAVTGILLAAAGVGCTSSPVPRCGTASIAAVLLAQACKALLIGRQADSRMVRAIAARLAEQPEVDEIFIQPVPRSDPNLRHKVLDRYGRVLTSG